jgi:hypothetical protein
MTEILAMPYFKNQNARSWRRRYGHEHELAERIKAAAFVGTVAFLAWTVRVRNLPQFTVNVIALAIGFVGLYRAFG